MKPPDIAMQEPDPLLAGGQGACRSHLVLRVDAQRGTQREADLLAEETAVALEYNGISHATLLASPCDLEDLAYGFSYTEGIIRGPHDMRDVELVERGNGLVLQMQIASACLDQLKRRRRSLAGRSGCGLCGIESLDEVRRDLPPLAPRGTRVAASAVVTAVAELRGMQALHAATGATHAAGWADAAGKIMLVREDVGRHNALDKLIGHLLRNAVETADGIAVVSSRASFEMVEKSAAAGISVLAAVSAATSYATRTAEELNVMLAGFTRGRQFTVYSHPEYLNREGDPSR
ncbi:formate dehydrogenase accessory sulfurtransferase FdhD [Candidimonas nitroreducens]|nr:formate dehydrogenase accessory sulfurtransferase FdhD [Candidimonas nitroreducens]